MEGVKLLRVGKRLKAKGKGGKEMFLNYAACGEILKFSICCYTIFISFFSKFH